MIYALLFNGASTVPLFVPLLPQLLLIYFAARYFDLDILKNSSAKFYFLAISFFLFFLAIASGMISELELFLRFFKLFLNSIFAIFAAVALAGRYGNDFAKVYTVAITKLSLLGILGLILSSITDWNLAANIAERSYHTNLLTVWIADGEVSSSGTSFSPFVYRLQSFFDEPGTYGMFLIPALYFAIYQRRAVPIIILIASIFLSESANAWIGAMILFIIYILRTSSAVQKALISAVLVSVLIAFYDVLKTLYEVKMGIDEAYANASSFGTREMEYRYLLDNLLAHAAPLSHLGRAQAALPGVSSAYVDWTIHGGWAFLFLLFCGLIATAMVFVKIRVAARVQSYFPFVLALTFFMSGFQRASVLDNILFMTLFYWSLLALSRRDKYAVTGEMIEYSRC